MAHMGTIWGLCRDNLRNYYVGIIWGPGSAMLLMTPFSLGNCCFADCGSLGVGERRTGGQQRIKE